MFKKICFSMARILPAIALFIGVISVNSACNTVFHQEKAPAAMEKYKKF